jgi:hypothetical protein
MQVNKDVVVAIPIYQAGMSELEEFSVDQSLIALQGRSIVFIAPEGLDVSYYTSRYPLVPIEYFEASCFSSIPNYNRLLMGRGLYERFSAYEFLLILQTDAVIFHDSLTHWINQPFDYIGAPWPEGVEIFVNLDQFEGEYGRRIKALVGNGGLSLRRIKKCLALIDEFPNAINVFTHSGSSEDLFFSMMGNLSADFVLPNEITASRFAMELRPSYYYGVNGHTLPMGAHAWWKYEPEFWRPFFKQPPPLALVAGQG